MVEQQLFQYESTISGKTPFRGRPIWGTHFSPSENRRYLVLIGLPNHSVGMVGPRHPKIASLVSNLFYAGRLLTPSSVTQEMFFGPLPEGMGHKCYL